MANHTLYAGDICHNFKPSLDALIRKLDGHRGVVGDRWAVLERIADINNTKGLSDHDFMVAQLKGAVFTSKWLQLTTNVSPLSELAVALEDIHEFAGPIVKAHNAGRRTTDLDSVKLRKLYNNLSGQLERAMVCLYELSADVAALAVNVRNESCIATANETARKLAGDPPATIPLTANEQAFYDLLTSKGQTGKVLAAALARKGILAIGEAEISKMWKLSHMKARGVRHRKGSGYYLLKYNPKIKPS